MNMILRKAKSFIFKIRKSHIIKIVNGRLSGPFKYEKKRKLLNKIGYELAEGVRIVGPVFCSGKLVVDSNSFIGRNFTVNGNGTCYVGKNVDIAPDVIVYTGSHTIGDSTRRAGSGFNKNIRIGDGCWICARTSIIEGATIGNSCVVAAGSVVNKNVPNNSLIGGVPARIIKELD